MENLNQKLGKKFTMRVVKYWKILPRELVLYLEAQDTPMNNLIN